MAELYLPAADPNALRAAIQRARAAAEALTGEGTPVRYLRSTFIPSDEVCFLFIEAASPDEVTRLGVRSDLAFDRIVQTLSDGRAGEVTMPPRPPRRR